MMMEGRMVRQTDGWTDGRTDGRTDRQTDTDRQAEMFTNVLLANNSMLTCNIPITECPYV